MTTARTLFTTLLILALPLFMLGCDGGGSAMEEPQQMEELKLSIYHPPETKAQTNDVTITRDSSDLQSGDLLNIFVNGPNERKALGVKYPNPGDTVVAEFVVPAGDYDVDLLGFRDLDNPDRNSAIVFATTGDDRSVNVTSGEVTEVDFTGGGASQGDGSGELLSYFDLSFKANLEFSSQGNSGAPKELNVELTNNGNNAGASDLAGRIFDANNTGLGGVGIDPDEIVLNSNSETPARKNANNFADFTSLDGSTLSTSEDALKLPPGQYRDGTASVLLELRINDDYVGDDQDPVYLYNNVDGSAQDGVNIGGDGGIIVII